MQLLRKQRNTDNFTVLNAKTHWSRRTWFSAFSDFWHQPTFAKFTYAWNWRLCGKNPVITLLVITDVMTHDCQLWDLSRNKNKASWWKFPLMWHFVLTFKMKVLSPILRQRVFSLHFLWSKIFIWNFETLLPDCSIPPQKKVNLAITVWRNSKSHKNDTG